MQTCKHANQNSNLQCNQLQLNEKGHWRQREGEKNARVRVINIPFHSQAHSRLTDPMTNARKEKKKEKRETTNSTCMPFSFSAFFSSRVYSSNFLARSSRDPFWMQFADIQYS